MGASHGERSAIEVSKTQKIFLDSANKIEEPVNKTKGKNPMPQSLHGNMSDYGSY